MKQNIKLFEQFNMENVISPMFLETLNDNEIKEYFDAENIDDLSDYGSLGVIKNFLNKKRGLGSLGSYINGIENHLMSIVYDRWSKNIK